MSTFSLSPDLLVRPTAHGGRGVFAARNLPTGTALLAVPAPIAHVVYRIYRREACAECFAYDNGQHWRVSSCAGAVFFCTDDCLQAWEARAGELGMRAWTSVEEWVKKKKAARAPENEEDSEPHVPDAAQIERMWQETQNTADAMDGLHGHKAQANAIRTVRALRAHPDVLYLLLSGIITIHNEPAKLAELMLLAPTPAPYRTVEILREHAESFLALRRLVPLEMRPAASAAVVREIALRDACNSFGMWSQPEDDGAEMLGFGIWAMSSFFNHSCDPAIEKTREGRAWRFDLVRPVAAGEELCISYLGEVELREWTYNLRQQQLKKSWGFDCACPRCEM